MDPKEWKLIEHLMNVTRNWNAFDLVLPEEAAIVRAIGVELDKLGGYDLMLFGYRTAKSANRYVTAIQAYWDGIGAWRW